MNMVGLAKLHLGSYEQAATWFRRSKEANRNYPSAHFNLAAALTQLGRLNEAHSAVKAGLALNPAYTVSRVRAAWTARSDDPTYLAQLEPIFDGMRKADVPEQ
jgi:tetratricopeptide (TPR) repeat protein